MLKRVIHPGEILKDESTEMGVTRNVFSKPD